MVSLSPWTKKSGGCREVAVIAEVRLYIKAWRNRLQRKPATGDYFSFPSHFIDATRCIYIFSLVSEKVPRALKFDWIFWHVIVLGNDYRFCTHFRFAHVFCTVPKQSIVAFKASMAYLVFLMIQVRLDDCIKPYNFMFSRTQIIDLSFMTG